MDFLLNRYRNLVVLLVVIVGQLLLLAYQVKSNHEVRLVRVWAVTAITPIARTIEAVRSSTFGFFNDYFFLLDVRDENHRTKAENGRLKLENQFLKTELATADRARALAAFQTRSPSRTVAARIIGNGTGTNSQVVFVDRGSTSGVQDGMAVITPDGIVGKVIGVYPLASQVMLITDQNFAAGVISEKNRVHGTLRGLGRGTCQVNWVQNEEKLDQGEKFYTSGDDRVFPKGLPVGEVSTTKRGVDFKEIYVVPSGFQNGFEEVLIVLEGVHQPIPDAPEASPNIRLMAAPPVEPGTTSLPVGSTSPKALNTDADRLLDHYKKVGQAQKYTYGDTTPGVKSPNFNLNPEEALKKAAAAAAEAAQTPPGTAPAGTPVPPVTPPATPPAPQSRP